MADEQSVILAASDKTTARKLLTALNESAQYAGSFVSSTPRRQIREIGSGGTSSAAPSGKIYGVIQKAVQCPVYVTGGNSLPAPALGSDSAKHPAKKTDKPVKTGYGDVDGNNKFVDRPKTDTSPGITKEEAEAAYVKACNKWYAWMCIGNVAVEGQDYKKTPKTYEGGEVYYVDDAGNEVEAGADGATQKRRKKTDLVKREPTPDEAEQIANGETVDLTEHEKKQKNKTDSDNNAAYDSDFLLAYEESGEYALQYDEVMCLSLSWDEVLPSGLRVELTEGSYEYEQYKTDEYNDILCKGYIGTVATADLLPLTAPSNPQDIYRVGDVNFGSYVWYCWDASGGWVTINTTDLEPDIIIVKKTCYKAVPPESYATKLNGQGDYEDFIPEWLEDDDTELKRRIHKLKEVKDSSPKQYAEAELLSIDGVCRNKDDVYSSMTVTDDTGTKFTFLVYLDMIPVLAFVQARYITCYYANEASDCNPEYTTPNYQIERTRIENEERLELTGGECLQVCEACSE
ncbi:MAG: hypothetical protein LBT46_15505 [Planctomycetaceae bacterium]|jgi:hypothetical protein|nr:hypothetical protein [Planctomycetaceae bacterium]